MSNTLRTLINNGEININNHESFFFSIIKGLIYSLTEKIKLRDSKIPHVIISTGDDIMYRELLNYSYSFDDISDVTGEDFIYNQVPRCVVDFDSINSIPDQLTQPYVRGLFEIERDGELTEFSSELMRIPLSIDVNLKYYVDSFSDSLSLIQQIFTEVSYIQKYKITYLGQTIECTVQMPDTHTVEKQIEVDFNSDNRSRIISMSVVLNTNIPVYNQRSAVETSRVIKTTKSNLYDNNDNLLQSTEESYI